MAAVSTPVIQPSFYDQVSKAGTWMAQGAKSFVANAGATAKSVSESALELLRRFGAGLKYYFNLAKDATVSGFGKARDVFLGLPKQHQYAAAAAGLAAVLGVAYLCLRNKGDAKAADPASTEVKGDAVKDDAKKV